MRRRRRSHGLTVQAIAGTHTVLLGMDLDAPAGCLGFAIHRMDHTEGDCRWLRGMKTFPSVVPEPSPGADFSSREQPIQGFQWGDYSVKPGHEYTYTVSALGGAPAELSVLATTIVRLSTELEDDGVHGVWFNRGVAGSQAFARRFAGWVPGDVPDESHPAMRWLSRGLGEAFEAFCAEAVGDGWGLRGAFYELTWDSGLAALAGARGRGVDVGLLVHGRDRDARPEANDDRTAEQARAAVARHDLGDVVTWRVARNASALQHNKFLVLTHHGEAVAVWTGSTNLTLGAVYGHSNVGHLVRSRSLAAQYLAEWQRLVDGETTQQLRAEHDADPVRTVVPAAPDLGLVLSPRSSLEVLQWYAELFDSATSSAHVTGAFGLNAVFRDRLAVPRPSVSRTVLLDKVPRAGQRIPLTDPHVRLSTGSHLAGGPLEQWAAERLTGFNTHVRYIHTKIILVDPLSDDPTVLTGSANYSDASTRSNEENTLIVRRGRSRAASRRAVLRVADIYLTEYHRLFMHHVFRAMADRVEINTGTRSWSGHLEETDAWSTRYYAQGSWRAQQRRLFAGTALPGP